MKALINKDLKIVEKGIPLLKENHSLLKVVLSGICRTDIYVAKGLIDTKKSIVLGHEFCAFIEKSDVYEKNTLVAVNPLLKDLKFIGIDQDGSFAEYCLIPNENIYPIETKNLKLAAYIEPISASLAPLNIDLTKREVFIFGKDRIAQLTSLVLKRSGIESKLIDYEEMPDNSCDLIIETKINEENFKDIVRSLKFKGTLVLKSRNPNLEKICFYDLVKKEIDIQSCYYYDFQKTIDFALKNEDLFNPLFGETYNLEDYEEAFKADQKGQKKIFFEL